jgi:hypothetical protein
LIGEARPGGGDPIGDSQIMGGCLHGLLMAMPLPRFIAADPSEHEQYCRKKGARIAEQKLARAIGAQIIGNFVKNIGHAWSRSLSVSLATCGGVSDATRGRDRLFALFIAVLTALSNVTEFSPFRVIMRA